MITSQKVVIDSVHNSSLILLVDNVHLSLLRANFFGFERLSPRGASYSYVDHDFIYIVGFFHLVVFFRILLNPKLCFLKSFNKCFDSKSVYWCIDYSLVVPLSGHYIFRLNPAGCLKTLKYYSIITSCVHIFLIKDSCAQHVNL